MSYTYVQMHLNKTAHNLKYKYGSSFTPTEITYHQTYNKAAAINERNYLNTRTDSTYIGFHIVVDDKQAIECIPLNIQTWHAGDGNKGAGNMKSIGIEIAYSTHPDLALRNQAIENGAEVIAKLMKDYNIPMSKVKPHFDRSGKNCPHDIRGRYGESKFRELIEKKFSELTKQHPSTIPNLYRIRLSWNDVSSQKGAYTSLENAMTECKKHSGYSVYSQNGEVLYSNNDEIVKIGSKVQITGNNYATGQLIPSWVKKSTFFVTDIRDDRALLSGINSWVFINDLIIK